MIVEGGCHCGAVRFRAQSALTETSRCNCSICAKGRFWKTMVAASLFTVTKGEANLGDYGENIHHRFCKTCGVKVFGTVSFEGQDLVAINVMSIDGLTPAQLAALPVKYEDGRHDASAQKPAVSSYL